MLNVSICFSLCVSLVLYRSAENDVLYMQFNHFDFIENFAENSPVLKSFFSFPFLLAQADVFGLILIDNLFSCIMSNMGFFVIKLSYTDCIAVEPSEAYPLRLH